MHCVDCCILLHARVHVFGFVCVKLFMRPSCVLCQSRADFSDIVPWSASRPFSCHGRVRMTAAFICQHPHGFMKRIPMKIPLYDVGWMQRTNSNKERWYFVKLQVPSIAVRSHIKGRLPSDVKPQHRPRFCRSATSFSSPSNDRDSVVMLTSPANGL